MPAPADLVFQQTTSTGTGDLTLSTVAGKRTFVSAFGTGNTNTFDYFISSKAAAEWEIGVGYIDTSTGDLVRNTVSLSSNSNSAVNFGAGTKDITNDIKASDQVRGAGTVSNSHAVLFDGTSGSLIKSAGFGLGSISSQAANNVSITGGSISGATISGGTISSLSSALGVTSGGTGLTSLTAGDTLYASATNTLARLAKGTDGQFLKLVSGLPAWGSVTASVGSVSMQVFTGSTTYVSPTGLIGAIVICTGGGGAGTGAGSCGGTVYKAVCGGGGGAGATAISFLTASQINASNKSISIGSGGSPGAVISTTTSFTAGGNGSSTSFSTLVVATGGSGAPAYTGANTNTIHPGDTALGGTGGLASGSTGSLRLAGQDGTRGTANLHTSNNNITNLSGTYGGRGGNSFFGQSGYQAWCRNGAGAVAGQTPTAGSYGAGGGGGAWNGSNGVQAVQGGSGAAGVCVVFEFSAA